MSFNSQDFESYLPVYDAVPESWEDAKPFFVEQLKKISNAVNIRTIGWLLDQELLSGQSFIPGETLPGANPVEFRQVFRKVINVSPILVGANTYAHGVVFDSNFTLIDLWVAATKSTATRQAQVITSDALIMSETDLTITSTYAYDRAFCVLEYILER